MDVLHYQIGTDIEDYKCSWLVVKAMELSNEEQKKLLHVRHILSSHYSVFSWKSYLICSFMKKISQEKYGKEDPTSVAKVKELYNTLNLQVSLVLPFLILIC